MTQRKEGKLVIFSAPSGSGKTTLVRHLIEHFPSLSFSISATSRPPRGAEQHGHDYYFLSAEEFQTKVEQQEFLEWEEVYEGTYYGTLRAEVERLWELGKTVAFDIDVVGGLRLKEYFGNRALAVFVQAPNLEELRHRLEQRGTDSQEKIEQRLAKADLEMQRAPEFDLVIINDQLERAQEEARNALSKFLSDAQ